MNDFLLGVIVAGLPLLIIEGLSRWRQLAPEISRKLTHVLSALAVVSLTLFCSLMQIALIAGLFFVLLAALRPKHLWVSLYRVKRRTWGELTFPLGVCVAAFFAHDSRVFICVILIIGLADTAANLIGQRYGTRKLPVFNTKSYAGSAAFITISLVIITLCFNNLSAYLVGVALIATIAELIAANGYDNFSVALLTTLAFRVLS